MTPEQFDSLERGDIVRNIASSNTYAVLRASSGGSEVKLNPCFIDQGLIWRDATDAREGRGRTNRRWLLKVHRGGWDLVEKNGAPGI